MLKSILFLLMIIFIAVRFICISILIVFGTALPTLVIVFTSLTVLYGVLLAAKKFVLSIRLKEIMWFFTIQAAIVALNLGYMVLIGFPLQLRVSEIITVGTFLDILVAICVTYYVIKHLRRTSSQQVRKIDV